MIISMTYREATTDINQLQFDSNLLGIIEHSTNKGKGRAVSDLIETSTANMEATQQRLNDD